MYTNISVSPDGNYVMITKINKPFSYLVTYRRFPTSVDIYSSDARLISNLIDLPLIEELPKGFMSVRTGKRNFSWRADKPSTLTYVEPLDGGVGTPKTRSPLLRVRYDTDESVAVAK